MSVKRTRSKVLLHAGIPAAALVTSRDLVDGDYLRERGFWDTHGAGVLLGLPWRASFGRSAEVAPELGPDTDAVLGHVLGAPPARLTLVPERLAQTG
jgi:crotonobetainyl-CoA:carnitine CoA-transferase CaiB-like acyl-CoA transferase